MNPQEAKLIADFLVADYEREMQTTLRVIEAVPSGNLSYQPDPKSKTALGLVRHLALEDAWVLNCIANGEFKDLRDDSDGCGIMTPAEGAARYEADASAALNRVRSMTGEQLATVQDLLGMFQAPAVHMLAMAVKHSVHHRGQLSTYLRAMGGKIPGIYGPSADTQ